MVTKEELAQQSKEGLDVEKKAYDLLKDPNLIPWIIHEIHKDVVREYKNITALININWVRLVKNAHATSSNLAINAYSRSVRIGWLNNLTKY